MVPIMKTLCLILLIVGGCLSTFAQERVPVNLKDLRLDDAVRLLADQAGINLILTKEIDKKVTIQLKDDIPPLKLLETIVNAHGYNLVKRDQIYTLEEKAAVAQKEKTSIDSQLAIPDKEATSGSEEKNYFQLLRTPVEQAEAKIRSMLSAQGKLEVNRQSNTVFVEDDPAVIKKIRDYVEFLNLDPNVAVSARLQQRSFQLNRLSTEEVVANISGFLTPEKGKAVVDKASRMLVVTDSEEVLSRVAEYINNADKPEAQVYIRFHVMEVTLNANTLAGFEMGDTDGWKIDDVGGSSFYDFIDPRTPNAPSVATDPSLSFTTKDGFFMSASANAIRDNARLLASPNLLCLNKLTSKIEVTQELPYIQSQTSTETAPPTTTSTVQFKDAGIKLEVTPDIYSDGTVKLNLKAEVSENVRDFPVEGQGTVPVIKKKIVESNVLSKDRETIVIGGILEDTIRKQREKVPFLGDIPLLGFLFSSENQTVVKTELLIFMNISIVGEQYLKNMAQQEWEAQQEKFEKYDTEFEFYPHLKQRLEMDDLNPDYEKK